MVLFAKLNSRLKIVCQQYRPRVNSLFRKDYCKLTTGKESNPYLEKKGVTILHGHKKSHPPGSFFC